MRNIEKGMNGCKDVYKEEDKLFSKRKNRGDCRKYLN